MHAGHEQRAVDVRGELLDARVQRFAAGRVRTGLDDAGVVVGFHHAHERGEAVAAHHAVGIEHDHVFVVLAPAPAEIGDVAALALDAMPAQAIEDAAEAAGVAAQVEPRAALGDARVRIAGVAQEKEIEAVEQTGARDRFVGRAHAGEHARGVFVADRHDDGGARVFGDRFVAADRRGDRKAVAAFAQQHEQAGHRCPESGGNPRDQDAEQREDRDLHRLAAVIRQHFRHERRRQIRLREQQHEQHAAADFRRASASGCAAGVSSRGARRRSPTAANASARSAFSPAKASMLAARRGVAVSAGSKPARRRRAFSESKAGLSSPTGLPAMRSCARSMAGRPDVWTSISSDTVWP